MTARNCPVLTVVSAPTWKHWVVALVTLAVPVAVLSAGYAYPQWSAGYGPGVSRLFPATASPVISWAMTLILFTTAQAAWIVWWARSRSLRDFGGSYRIWGWAAGTWLLFSFASATQAHLAWSETILHHIHWRTPGAMLWCWLLPASAWGWGLALRLEQELREDRPAHWLFLTAGAWYLGVVGILCQREFWPQACAAELSQLLLTASELVGHAALFLSTALHARYVLLCTAEPPAARRRIQAKAVAAPQEEKEHTPVYWPGILAIVLWPLWLLRWLRRNVATDGEGKPKRGRKRAAPKKRLAQRKATRAAKVADEGDEESETDEEFGSGEATSDGKRYRIDPAEEPEGEEYTDTDDDESGDSKGLSKRDRRKQQQQLREQERQARR